MKEILIYIYQERSSEFKTHNIVKSTYQQLNIGFKLLVVVIGA